MGRSVLCLDWDKRSLRFVVASVGGGSLRLLDAHQYRVPAGVDSDDPAAMGPFIATSLERHRVRIKKCIVDVPREKAVINRLKLPPTPAVELAAAVRFQALRELPFPLEDAQIDFSVLERDASKNAVEVLLAAARNDTLTRIRETCVAAGLTPVRVGLRPYANLLSVGRLPAMLERRVLFVDVGPLTTEIDVFRGTTLAFSRAASVSVPFQGGELVSEASRIIARADAADLDQVDEAEESTVDELVVEITRTLQAYRATEPSATIDQIVIAGGTGVEHALLSAVEDKFSAPATIFDPTTALGVPDSESNKLRSFSAALGLAWGMSRDGHLAIDFLNPKRPIPKGEVLKRRVQLVTAAVVLVFGGVLSWVVVERVNLNKRLSTLLAQNEAKLVDFKAISQLQVRAEAAGHWATEEKLTAWLDPLLDVTRSAVEPGKKMIITDWNSSLDKDRCRVTLRLACDNMKVAEDFARSVEEVKDEKNRQRYEVVLGTWTESKANNDKFKGSIQADVRVLDPYLEKDAAKARDDRLKDIPKAP